MSTRPHFLLAFCLCGYLGASNVFRWTHDIPCMCFSNGSFDSRGSIVTSWKILKRHKWKHDNPNKSAWGHLITHCTLDYHRPKSPLYVFMRRFRSPWNTSWFIQGHTGLIYGCCGRHLKAQWTPESPFFIFMWIFFLAPYSQSLRGCGSTGFSVWNLRATLSCPQWFGHLEVHKESHMSLCVDEQESS